MRDSGVCSFSTRIPLQLPNSRPTAGSPRSPSNRAEQCSVRLPLHRLLCIQKLVRARRVFFQRKPSNAQVRNVSFFQGNTATNLVALLWFLSLFSKKTLLLSSNLKKSNPFTFVDYLFYSLHVNPILHDPCPSLSSTHGSGWLNVLVVAEWVSCLDSRIVVRVSSTVMDRVYPLQPLGGMAFCS